MTSYACLAICHTANLHKDHEANPAQYPYRMEIG